MNLKRYFTGYLTGDWYQYPVPPYKGRGWYITLENTEKCINSGVFDDKLYPAKEVTIHCHSLDAAKNVLDLINCAILAHSGQAPFVELDHVIPEDKEDQKLFSEEDLTILTHGSSMTDGYPVACMIAAKASHRKELQYALAKFRLATMLYSHYMIDLDPTNHAYEHIGVSSSFSRHTQYAYSIIASYSVIEELRLEIRASREKPSQIDGKWNTIVRCDLEHRLQRSHVDLKKGIYWLVRGSPTRLQKAKTLSIIKKPSHRHNPYIRDSFIDVCDAILLASYLRSKVSSHKSGPLVKSLTGIDSENVRHLARCLLLSRLGFWRYKPKLKR